MDKRLTRWIAVMLLGCMTFLGGCGTQNPTVNPESPKASVGADTKTGKKEAQASDRTLYRVGKNGSSKPRR